MKSVLFICTGNYYRSRFAEILFRHLARQRELPWTASSRGLRVDPNRNPGPLAEEAVRRLDALGILLDPQRLPESLTERDLFAADTVIAVKRSEHLPLMQSLFPRWASAITYWQIDDVDCSPPELALRELEAEVKSLLTRFEMERLESVGPRQRLRRV